MLRFFNFINLHEDFLIEGVRKSLFTDEHAFAKVWNHSVATNNTSEEHLTSEVEKAKKDPEHPLSIETHVATQGRTGFGSKTNIASPEARDHYYKELHKAAQTVSHLVKPDEEGNEFTSAHKSGHLATVTGSQKAGKLTPEWTKHKAVDKTSKSDIHIAPKHSEEKSVAPIRISYKDSAGSQLAAAGPEQMSATIEHASKKLLAQEGSGHTEQKHNQLMKHVAKLASQMRAANKATNDEERGQSLAQAKETFKTIKSVHPDLIHHIAHEAATGEGQFGAGAASTATHVVSSFNKKTKETKVVRAADFNANNLAKRETNPDGMRVSYGKGQLKSKDKVGYRTHVVRMDLKS